MRWPSSAAELRSVQTELAAASPPPWRPPRGAYAIGGCFACFGRGKARAGARAERGWAGAAVWASDRLVGAGAVEGRAGAGYEPGLLAFREGRLLEAAVRALPALPDVLLVNATGRDHPRRCGLALHLGAVLGLPTVGVTHRPLLAEGGWPPESAGARAPLSIGGEGVGCWLRTRPRTRPLAVHPGWRTDAETACAVVLAAIERARTPEPLREARRRARLARAGCRAGARSA